MTRTTAPATKLKEKARDPVRPRFFLFWLELVSLNSGCLRLCHHSRDRGNLHQGKIRQTRQGGRDKGDAENAGWDPTLAFRMATTTGRHEASVARNHDEVRKVLARGNLDKSNSTACALGDGLSPFRDCGNVGNDEREVSVTFWSAGKQDVVSNCPTGTVTSQSDKTTLWLDDGKWRPVAAGRLLRCDAFFEQSARTHTAVSDRRFVTTTTFVVEDQGRSLAGI